MKRDAIDHPKMELLAQLLHIEVGHANGIMERLWHWTAKHVPRGNIGQYSNQHIVTSALRTELNANEVIQALVKARLLDEVKEHRLVVHDWPLHCEDRVHSTLAKASETFWDGTPPKLSKYAQDERPPLAKGYTAERMDELWAIFWATWPRHRKQNKAHARKKWDQLIRSEALARDVIRAVEIQKQPGGPLAREPQYIPYAYTWLHNHRWEDEYNPNPRPELYNAEPEREPTDEDVLLGLT